MAGWIRRHRVLVIIIVLVVVLVIVRAVRGNTPEVEVARAEYGGLTLPIAASGLVEARSSDLGFKSTGRLVEVYVNEGERVAQDQLLARIYPSASLGPATADLGDVIRAPFSGSVVVIYRRPGAVVNPGEPVLRVVESGAEWVTAFVEAEDALILQPGQRLTCRAGGYLSQPFPIIVTEIGREAVPRPDLPASARQVRVRCRPADQSFNLPAGTEVDVDGVIPLLRRGLLIPTNAVVHRGTENFVWLVGGDDTVSRRDVQIGRNNFEQIAIEGGLQAGDTVVVSGKETLAEGQQVRTRPMPDLTRQPEADQ